MTRYTNVKVNISKGQKEKLQHAIKAGCPTVSIRLGYEDLEGNDILAVTNSQVKKLAKAHENGRGITIKMSSNQLKHGALSGLASSGVQKARGSGLYFKKGGCGLYLKPCKGKGLQSYGDGLYLKQGGQLYDGKGLLLGPNSTFANITILGAIL